MSTLPKIGDVIQVVVCRVCHSYAIMLFDEGYTGLLHISELSHKFIRSFSGYCKVGNIYTVKVIDVDEEKGSVRVSLKQMTANDRRKTLKPEPIDESKIDFTALQERLSNWIQEDDSSEGE